MRAEITTAMETLRAQLGTFPRCSLCQLPTPLEKLENLSRKLNLNLYMKRDDQTGLAMGGNKARKLEFILADALAQGADSIITWAGVQSNWCRQAAAAARRVGLQPFLVLFKRPGLPSEPDGNFLLDEICGADITIFGLPKGSSITYLRQVSKYIDLVAERIRKAGRKPYIVPIGGSLVEASTEGPWGAFGYVDAILELTDQGAKRELPIDYVVFPTSSGGTHAGLAAGAKLLSANTKIVGICVSDTCEDITSRVSMIGTETMGKFGMQTSSLDPSEILAFDDYVGDGYEMLDKKTVDAIRMVAEYEGILLDPVYTGKAMVGLLGLQEKGYFKPGQNVVFLHTGGTPALFPYREGILRHLNSKREVF